MSDQSYYSSLFHDQPTINIGMIGSVSNGKSSLVERLTRTKTQRHSHEKKTNKTIKLGYANAKIFKCDTCKAPSCYQSFSSCTYNPDCAEDPTHKLELVRHVSFVDCPGHNMLMATMLNGTCVMDSTVLVEAINNDMPASQTEEHLFAAKMMNMKNNIVCVNKMDLVKKEVAVQKIDKFKKYLIENDTIAKDSLIVPTVGNYDFNKDVLCEYLCTAIKDPVRDLKAEPKMIIIRSFNVNKCDKKIQDLIGGVVGGTVMRGVIKIGDQVEILPGLVKRNENINSEEDNKWTYLPLISSINSINSEKNSLRVAIPGGLIGVQLNIDPGFTEKDSLIGNIMRITSTKNKDKVDYKIFEKLYILLEVIKDDYQLKAGDTLMLNFNASNTPCEVIRVKKDRVQLDLEKPVCVEIGDFITLSKQIGLGVVLVGRGQIADGVSSTKSTIEQFCD
jgi:translation initiation factor 2 subunit 3